jgi:hypothetical protein
VIYHKSQRKKNDDRVSALKKVNAIMMLQMYFSATYDDIETFEKNNKGIVNTVWNEQMKGKRSSHEQQIIRQMKALYQYYTHDLISNQMTPTKRK